MIFTADGKLLASAAADGSVRLWDAQKGQPIYVWSGHEAARPSRLINLRRAGVQALAMTPDGRRLVSAGFEKELRAWDGVTGKQISTLALPELPNNVFLPFVGQVRISPDGRKAMALFSPQGPGGAGGGFPVPQGTPLTDWLANWDLQTGTLLDKRSVFRLGSRDSVLSRDGRIAVGTSAALDLHSGKEISSFKAAFGDSFRYSRAISPDGSLIAGSVDPNGVAFLETTTGKRIGYLITKQESDEKLEAAERPRFINMAPKKESDRPLFHPRYPLLALGDADGIRLWDLRTGKVVDTRKLPGKPEGAIASATDCTSMAFTPDGKRLATGHADGTILFWDLQLPASNPLHLPPNEIEALWADLRDADAAKAWQAVWRLADSPAEVVPFLAGKLKSSPSAPAATAGPLLADLDSGSFAKREAAAKQLTDLGLLAESALRAALTAKPSLEVRQRVEAILKAIADNQRPLTPEELRDTRAVAVVGSIATPQARQVLEGLTRGAPSARLTLAAKAAIAP